MPLTTPCVNHQTSMMYICSWTIIVRKGTKYSRLLRQTERQNKDGPQALPKLVALFARKLRFSVPLHLNMAERVREAVTCAVRPLLPCSGGCSAAKPLSQRLCCKLPFDGGVCWQSNYHMKQQDVRFVAMIEERMAKRPKTQSQSVRGDSIHCVVRMDNPGVITRALSM